MGLWDSVKSLLGGGATRALPPGPMAAERLESLAPSIALLHVLMIDASGSMRDHAASVVEAVEKQINALRVARGAELTAVMILSYDHEWRILLPPTLVREVTVLEEYRPDNYTNLYGCAKEAFELLLGWNLRRRGTSQEAAAITVTLLCDGQHTPELDHLWAEHGGDARAERIGNVRGLCGKDLDLAVIDEIIGEQRTAVRQASAGMMANGIDVQVIGYGIDGERIAEDLGFTRKHGVSVEGSQLALARAVDAVTAKVERKMSAIVLVRETPDDDLDF